MPISLGLKKKSPTVDTVLRTMEEMTSEWRGMERLPETELTRSYLEYDTGLHAVPQFRPLFVWLEYGSYYSTQPHAGAQ